jgi:hypothetical protein
MYLEDELDEEREDAELAEEEGDEAYGTLEEEETLEELDFDERGHIKPRRRRTVDEDEEQDPEY